MFQCDPRRTYNPGAVSPGWDIGTGFGLLQAVRKEVPRSRYGKGALSGALLKRDGLILAAS